MPGSDNSPQGRQALVVGDANVDVIVSLPRVENGEMVTKPDPRLEGGGTSANTAMALQKLGVQTRFLGSIGADGFGHVVLNEFSSAGLSTDHIIIEPDLSTVCVFAFIDEHGERHLWGWPREQQAFPEIDLNKVDWSVLSSTNWVHVSGLMLAYAASGRETVLELFRRASAMSIPTSIDLNLRLRSATIDPAYLSALEAVVEHASYVFGSANDELGHLYPAASWEQSAARLVRPGRTVIARSGADGAVLLKAGQPPVTVPAIPARVVDTIGAGDSFNAGFIAAMLAETDEIAAVKWGNATASYTVSRQGGRGTPSRAELEKLVSRYSD